MFWKRYYKRFSVRVEIIAYNCIIILCHLIEVAIFAVGDFFSLFGIAIFNIPITHKIIVLLFLLQSYCFFRYLQIFFNFFSFLPFRSPNNRKFYFSIVACVPVVCWSWSCVQWSPDNHTYAHTYTHTRARARGFLDSNF